jgi:hypothetical protein
VEVVSPTLDRSSNTTAAAAAVLVLADGLGDAAVEQIQRAKGDQTPIVILCEGGARTIGTPIDGDDVTATDDFVSALYFAAWAAAERA